MRHIFEMATVPSRGRFRPLTVLTLLLLLVLVSAPWRASWANSTAPSVSETCTVSVAPGRATRGSDETIDFEVTLRGRNDCTTSTVEWEVIEGWGTAPESNAGTAVSGSLTFAPGETTKTVSVPLMAQSASTNVETLYVLLASSSGVKQRPGSARGTIFPEQDTEAPWVTVTSTDAAPVSGAFYVDVTFSEPTTGFEISDLEVVNGSALRIIGPLWRYHGDPGMRYLIAIHPDHTPAGDVSVTVPAGVVTDLMGNGNTASALFAIAPVLNPGYGFALPPTLSCDGVSGGGFAGTPFDLNVEYGIAGRFHSQVPVSIVAVTQDGVDVAAYTGVSGGRSPWGTTYNFGAILREGVTGTVLVQIMPGAARDRLGRPTGPSNTLHIAHNWTASISDANATEGADETIEFEVQLNARDDCRTVTVDWAVTGGTATADEDYTAAGGTLTFAPGETTKTVSIPLLDDATYEGDETLTLQLSNAVVAQLGLWPTDIAIADAEATSTISDDDPEPPIDLLTARFENVPESHDGATAFTVELHFSEDIPGLSYTTVAGGLLDVTGANVTGARRLTAGSNQDWLVTVAPSGSDDISITLPARACGAAATICISDNRPLSEGISATVQVEPQAAQQSGGGGGALTARFENVPEAHDGATAFTVELHFSENIPGLSYKTVAGGLFDVTGANVTGARRLTPGSNQDWLVTVAPSVDADVTLTVPGTDNCAAPNAICVGDDRKLEAGASATITVTPIAVTVADTEVEEAEGATLDFVVTMNRASARDIQISYRAYDGTATAGEDYVAVYSSFTMTAGETTKTVSVSVLDDALDEGAETVNFWLSGVRGLSASQLTDPYAVGTITNSDPMPAAWITRFGRTVGSQVIDAVTSRFEGATDSHVTVGGQRIGMSELFEGADTPVFEDLRQWAEGDENNRAEWRDEGRTVTSREILLGSSFHLSAGNGAKGGTAFAAWGEVATGGFEADVDDVRMDGEVTTGMIGIDAEWDQLLAGVMLSRSEGDGSYRLSAALGNDGGTVESSLTGVYPYLRLEMGEGVSAWGLAGYGTGSLTLRQDGQDPIETDLGMRMGAVGARGTVLDRPSEGGLELAVKSDAMWVQTESDRTVGLESAEGDVTRVRVILEGDRVFKLGDDETLTPKGEIGLRHDGGDAETGTGVEIGAGIRYAGGTVSVEASVRTLVAHEESGYEEWGASGAIHVSPDASGRGLSLNIAPGWGSTTGGSDRLWSAGDPTAFGLDNAYQPEGRLEAELGYGLGLSGRGSVLIPYVGLGLGGGESRVYRMGSRWQVTRDVALDIEGARREEADGNGAEHGLMLRGKMRW